MARKKQAGRGNQRETGSQKKKASSGTAKLMTAVNKKLDESSDKIADSLYERLIDGNVKCGELLIALAEGWIDCEDEAVVQRLCSLAKELASEPEWEGELDEAEAESGLGHRELEA